MRSLLVIVLGCLLPLSAAHAWGVKPNQVSVGSYATSITYDNSLVEEDSFSGYSLSYTGALSRNLGLRATYFALEHDDYSAVEANGADLLVLGGSNLGRKGFQLFAGGGYFTETWDYPGGSMDFSGFQLAGGIGHNWRSVALDFLLAFRDITDYKDQISDNTATAASASLSLGYRF